MAQNKFLIDVELMNDPQLFVIGQKWGRERAFAWFVFLLSAMRKQAGNRIHYRPAFIAQTLGIVDVDDFAAFIADLLHAKLIQKDRRGNLWSRNLSNSVADYDARCETNRNNRLLKFRRVENKPVELLPIIGNESKSNRTTNAKISTSTNTKITYRNKSTINTPNPNPCIVPSSVPVPSCNLDLNQKKPYGEFGNVFFTEDEYQKLFERMNRDERNMARLIERLGCWEKIGTKKSHYRVALAWGVAAVLEERTKLEPKKITLYSDEIKKRNEETIKRFILSND